jgi:hypothetical protein
MSGKYGKLGKPITAQNSNWNLIVSLLYFIAVFLYSLTELELNYDLD